MGVCSFLGLPLGAAAYWLADVGGQGAAGVGSSIMAAIGVLAAAGAGMVASIASRERQERWPWLGVTGALVSKAPLLLFIVAFIVHH
jgi:hypothetical protein